MSKVHPAVDVPEQIFVFLTALRPSLRRICGSHPNSDFAGRASWISVHPARVDVLDSYLSAKALNPSSTSACILCPVALSLELLSQLRHMHRITSFPRHTRLHDAAPLLQEDFALWYDACVPQLNAITKSDLTIQFTALVSGAPACALLDTGAGGTFISHEFVQRSGIAVLPCGPDSYTSATSANGSAVQIMGMAVCHLTIQDLHCKIRCLVADLGSSWDLIVGQPWLLEHRAELSYNRLDAVVHKGSRRIYCVVIVLRCGSSDGVAALDPSDPSSVAVGSVPVLSAVQMNRLLTEPGHRIFSVHVTAAEVSQSSGASPGASLGAVPHDGVRQVLLDFADRFPDDLPPGLPPDRGVSHTIPLEPGSRPVHRSMYRLSPSEQAEVERTVKELLAKGFIEPATSPYGSPILFVAKKDGTIRMVMDYRALNRISVRRKYPFDKCPGRF